MQSGNVTIYDAVSVPTTNWNKHATDTTAQCGISVCSENNENNLSNFSHRLPKCLSQADSEDMKELTSRSF